MRIGILGCGHVSGQYFAGLEPFEHLEIVAVADLDRARAEAVAAERGVARACLPDELFADPAVELVVNLTPPQAHAETSLAAMRAGKHVWSEKPLATTLEDGRALLTAAREAGVRLGCAPDTWLGGGLQTAIKLLEDGWLGKSIAGGVALVTEHGYEHFHPEVHAFYRTGPVLDLGPYYVSALAVMLGPVARVTGMGHATFPERVVGVGPRRGERIPVEVPTHVAGVLEFESGPIVNLLISWDVWATSLPFLEIYGEAGSLSISNPDEFGGEPRLRRAGAEELRQPPPPPGTVHWSPIPLIQPGDVGRGIGVADMALAIRDGRPHRASAELAYHVLEVLLALETSRREGRHVEVESRIAPLAVSGPKWDLFRS
jgi:predicted dehydrogenase